jgi:hypothetical protein
MKKAFLSLFILFGFLAVNAQTDSLQQYTGKYKFPDGSPVSEITMAVDNGLLMASSAMGSTEFRPTSTPDVFEVVVYGGTATFKRKEGKVTGVQILVGDVNIEGEKTEGLINNLPVSSVSFLRKQN